MARVKLGDVAREYKSTVRDAEGLPSVGLEHLTPGEITLEQWDEGGENTFTTDDLVKSQFNWPISLMKEVA